MDLDEELLAAVDRATQNGDAIWLYETDYPGHIHCFIGTDRIDFFVYVDGDVLCSAFDEVAAVVAKFRNMQSMFVQPLEVTPRLIALLQLAKDDRELFRIKQKECHESACEYLRRLA
jgi:hypothetical protein